MAKRKSRETYGCGSVTAEKRNGEVVRDSWRVCITLGKDSNGKRRRITRIVHGSLADARKVCKELSELYEHADLSASDMTFADVCAAWAESMRENGTCAPSKLKDYETRLAYVAAHLDRKPLAELTTDDLEKALSVVKTERNQSQRTYRDCKRHVKRVFKFAKRKHWIVFDASEDLETVSVRGKTERRSLEADQFARLRACVDRDLLSAMRDFEEKETRQAGWGNMFARSSIKGLANIGFLVGVRLLMATGMRRGECLALTWRKVDFVAGSILIDKALNADAVLKEPKTEAGTRCIAVDSETMALLAKWRDFQKKALHVVMAQGEDGKAQPVGQSIDTPVCCSCVGGFVNPHNMNRWWSGYRDSIGFRTLKLHELRHSSATLLLGNGMPPNDVAARLGHDDVSVTLNTYAHAIKAHDRVAADLLGALMNAPAEPKARVVRLDKTA